MPLVSQTRDKALGVLKRIEWPKQEREENRVIWVTNYTDYTNYIEYKLVFDKIDKIYTTNFQTQLINQAHSL